MQGQTFKTPELELLDSLDVLLVNDETRFFKVRIWKRKDIFEA